MDESKMANMEIRLQLNLHGILTLISASVASKGLVKQENPHEMDIDVECEWNKTAEDADASFTVISNENEVIKTPGFVIEEFTVRRIAKGTLLKKKIFGEKDLYTEQVLAERNSLGSYLYDTCTEKPKAGKDQLVSTVHSMSQSKASRESTVAIGIDIGNSKCVIAASIYGIVDVLRNDEGKRETAAVVHFALKHRLFGALAASMATSSPTTTVSDLKRLVDRDVSDNELRRVPYVTSWDTNGNVLVEVTYHDERRTFTAVEMLGMILSYLKKTSEITTGQRISDCVMAVPAFFNEAQRTAYLNAAKIAGWNPLGLLHDGTAAAMEYGISRPERAASSCVVFVDVGHSDTQVTVVQFDGKQRRVLGQAHDSTLGGRDFDEVLFEFFVKKFKKEYRIDASSNMKAQVRLRLACEKAKMMLSKNMEAEIREESLMRGVDVIGLVTREEFEINSRVLLDRIGKLFSKALADADVVANQVDSVELIGSGSRIPGISRTLAAISSIKMSKTLKRGECVARGCAIFCQMMLRGSEDELAKMLGLGKDEFTPAKIAVDDISDARAREKIFAEKDLCRSTN